MIVLVALKSAGRLKNAFPSETFKTYLLLFYPFLSKKEIKER